MINRVKLHSYKRDISLTFIINSGELINNEEGLKEDTEFVERLSRFVAYADNLEKHQLGNDDNRNPIST